MKVFILLTLILPQLAQAGDETQVAPKGIFGIRLNNVFVTGTDYEFGPDGQRRTVGDTHASNIRDQALHTAQDSVNGSSIGKGIYDGVIKALNGSSLGSFGLNLAANALQNLDLGVMKMNVVPTTQVTSPTILYGVTNWWNFIVNAPYIKQKMTVSWEYVPGSSTATLNQISSAANAVGVSIPNSSSFVPMATSTLVSKGYKAPVSNEKSFLADVYVMNLFHLGKVGSLSFGTMNTISLPTGPAHDADDILDPGSFHHTFVEQEFTAVYEITKKFKTYASGSVRYNIPEKTDWRVPATAYDQDPDASQKATINRQIGFGTMIEAGLKYRVLSRFNFAAGLIHNTKAADHFSGDKAGYYKFIEESYPYNAEESTSYKLGLTYDPLSNYKPGSIPVMVDLAYQEVLSGVNAPSLKQMMLSFSTFF